MSDLNRPNADPLAKRQLDVETTLWLKERYSHFIFIGNPRGSLQTTNLDNTPYTCAMTNDLNIVVKLFNKVKDLLARHTTVQKLKQVN